MSEGGGFPRDHARGQRTDYALDAAPIGQGGQADVFRATHKPTGRVVAFKRLTSSSDDAKARLRREGEIGTNLFHPNVMPVLDVSADATWLTMPLATTNLEDARTLYASDPSALADLVEAVCAGLHAAHDQGYVHRDIKPSNILNLGDRWVVSDWGLVRRARGETTHAGRTRIGQAYGTEGFAAPELSIDAHAAEATADIYSVGQMIGWLVTGELPLANVPRLPASGPWRTIVRAATQLEPVRRPNTMAAFLELVALELQEPPPLQGVQRAIELLGRIAGGDPAARIELIDLAVRVPDDYEIHVDALPRLREPDVVAAVSHDPSLALEVVTSYRAHLDGDWGMRSFDWANDVIRLIFRFADSAAELEQWSLLETSVDILLDWDAKWDRWGAQRTIRPWLSSLRGDAARIVAHALRQQPAAAVHFADVVEDRGVDPRVMAAIQAATGA